MLLWEKVKKHYEFSNELTPIKPSPTESESLQGYKSIKARFVGDEDN